MVTRLTVRPLGNMNKVLLDTFIKKYTLGGNVESVKMVVDDVGKTLKTSAITDDKSVLINVALSDFTATNSILFGVYNTTQLKQMVSVLGDEINIRPNINATNNKVTSLVFYDDSTEIQYVTADLDVIPSAPNIKKIPQFNLEIDFKESFITKFIRAKNALSDIDNFTLLMNKKNKLELVIGHSKLNRNRITLDVITKVGLNTVAKPISFSAKYLKEIFNSNNDCDDAVLKVSDDGLAFISFTKDNFTSSYYLVEIKNVD
jgi:hypothetical protein